MEKFAKLFENISNGQVLLTFDGWDDEQQHYIVTIRTDFKGFIAKQGVAFADEEKARRMFDNYSSDLAKEFRKAIRKNFA